MILQNILKVLRAALKYLDFLPDDEAVRRRFLIGLMLTLAKR